MYIIKSSTVNRSLRISKDQARSQRFSLILDLRSPKEREELGYYPNSIPVSIDQLHTEVPFLLGSKPNDYTIKNTHILVYSNMDQRAVSAAEILYNMGYHNVRYIKESYLSLLPGSQ
jgi:rhodanese-related sulfurtransferase